MLSTTSSVLLTVATGATLLLAGCSSASPAASSDEGTRVAVVASTNVYGDIASRIGGEHVEVTSIISRPSEDPHSYEANARVQLALSKAQLVIENGGGYDDFVDTLLAGAGNDDVTVLNATELSGYDRSAEGFNEHLWYDVPTVQKVAGAIVTALSSADEENADAYRANGDEFGNELQALADDEAGVSSGNAGDGVAITEPVPLYLLDAIGLVNKTPDQFSEAIEEGTDVPPAALLSTLALFTEGDVRLLAYNEQTIGPETELVLDAARDNGIPVVALTETLPEGEDYLSWMHGNVDAIAAALT